MATQMLGQTIVKKKVVSQQGQEIGQIYDLDFEVSGAITYIFVKLDGKNPELEQYLNDYNLLEIPYSDVKAIGEYVVVDFPKP